MIVYNLHTQDIINYLTNPNPQINDAYGED